LGIVGCRLGFLEGSRVGSALGFLEGMRVGSRDGGRVGSAVGFLDGCLVGSALGFRVGCRDGSIVGLAEGRNRHRSSIQFNDPSQSSFRRHFSPSSHGPQRLPPQSTLVSWPSLMPLRHM
jgi:outer membrane lipoprotein SlyB